MNEIIKINELVEIVDRIVGDETINTVDARKLHEFLQVGKMYSHWIKGRIEKYKFVENEDYVKIDSTGLPNLAGSNYGGFQGQINYYLSIDAAKEISMAENNTKGREARKYFIACEKKLKDVQNKTLAPVEKTTQEITADTLDKLSKEFQSALNLVKVAGIPEDKQRRTANEVVKKISGVDCLKLINHNQVIAKHGTCIPIYLPTQLGQCFLKGMPATKVNKLLESLGLQEFGIGDGGVNRWLPTPLAWKHCVTRFIGTKDDGTPMESLLWFSSVLEFIPSEYK